MLAPGTAGHWLPGRGIAADVRGRLPHYKDDWIQGCNWGVRCVSQGWRLAAVAVIHVSRNTAFCTTLSLPKAVTEMHKASRIL